MFGHNLTSCMREWLCAGWKKKVFLPWNSGSRQVLSAVSRSVPPAESDGILSRAASWDSPRHVSSSPARCPQGRGKGSELSDGFYDLSRKDGWKNRFMWGLDNLAWFWGSDSHAFFLFKWRWRVKAELSPPNWAICGRSPTLKGCRCSWRTERWKRKILRGDFFVLLENLILKFSLLVAIRRNHVCLFKESEAQRGGGSCDSNTPPSPLISGDASFPPWLFSFIPWSLLFFLSCLVFCSTIWFSFSHRGVFLVSACGTSEPPVKEWRDLRRDAVVD